MPIIICFVLAFLCLGMFLVGTGVNILWNPTKPGTSGSMRLFGGVGLVCAGLGVIYGWGEVVGWLVVSLK